MTASIVLAGGGSGGHLSPGLAVAERLHVLAPDVPVYFMCSNRPIDEQMLASAGAQFRVIPAEPFSRKPRKALRFVRGLYQGTRVSSAFLREVQAGAVLSLGGFVSAPVIRAAQRRGLWRLLLNLDAVPGKANRWAAGKVSEIRTAVPLRDPSLLGDPEQVGFPIRRIALASGDRASCRERLGLAPELPTVLVTGASQGAGTLNAFMREFVQNSAGVFEGWQVLHLSGVDDEKALTHTYAAAGIRAVVRPFLDQIGLAWGAAELAVSRAGANSVAEAVVNAVPTIFVPFPWHHDLHQRYNAESVVRAGGAVLALDAIDPAANLQALGEPLRELILDPAGRARMREVLQEEGKVDGAQAIAELLLTRIT